jgi:diguanylate cyclase (GGDEF)-like protein/PAS domain S-box-containing protein
VPAPEPPDTLAAALARLRDAEARWRHLVEHAPVVTYVAAFDAIGTLTYVSPQVEALLGHPPAAFLAGQDPERGGLWERLIHPDDRPRVLDATARAFDGGSTFECEFRMCAADGRTVHVLERDAVVRDEAGRPAYSQGVVLDVTALREAEAALRAEAADRRRAEEQVARLAHHDALTGLPNRALLAEHLELALARAQRHGTAVALLVLDLDDFKHVNDSLGHSAGDELLRQAGARLDAHRREADVLARPGGDEFLLLVADVADDPALVARTAADRMLAALAPPFVVEGTEFELGGSIGVSVSPRDAQDADTLLRHADAALYEAKAVARGEARIWSPARPQPGGGAARLSLATRLRRAVERDELVLHWQPVVRPLDGRVHGCEALVRWEHPERGLLAPGEFIPLAEETGLIERVGAWVVEAACAQAAAWRASGLELQTAVNVSARELRRGDWTARLLARLDAHGVPPGAVTVELTETTAMRGHARVEEQLAELHAAGVQLAIDDFGTGWSSLHRLRDVPVSVLKVDRSFLAGVPRLAEPTAIVRAILELGAALGKTVVAEGVEDERQLAFLVGQACPLAQGFLLGRPVPASELDLAGSRPWRSPSTSAGSSPSSSRTGGPARS